MSADTVQPVASIAVPDVDLDVVRTLDSMTDALIVYDREWRVQFFNSAAGDFFRVLGRDPDQVRGRNVWDMFPQAIGSRFQIETQRAVELQSPVEFDDHFPTMGQFYHVKAYPRPEGGLTVFILNVTAQREAEAKRFHMDARYKALLEAASEMVWTTEANGEITDLPDWRALTGQTVDEIRGSGWLNALHPDDRDAVRGIVTNAFKAGKAYVAEYRLRLADGSYRWFRARGVPVRDEHGTTLEWVGTLGDIDDDKRIEADKRDEARLIEELHDIGRTLASELTIETIVQKVTDSATTLTGAQFGAFFYNVVEKEGEKYTLYTLSGAPREAFENFGHPRPTPVFAPTFYGEAIIRSDDITKDPRYGKVGPHYGQPAGHLPVRSYLAVPVIARNGEVLGGLFFGHEKTGVFTPRAERLVAGIAASASVAIDNARLYKAEIDARSIAESANEAKSAFLANMSHELRTPLNAIGGYADLIIDGIRGPVTESQRADLQRIKRNQQHLLSIINDILNFAKLEAGHVSFACKDVPLTASLSEMEALVAPQLLEKNLSYEFVPCDSSFTVYTDPEKLQQVMLNLLSNALKFTPSGGRITVECRPGGEVMYVDVSDSGVGIPPDKLESIFEPFVQVDRAQPSGNAGTGLGLAISRDLMRAMHGDLTVSSEVGSGSTFRLTLPRHRTSTAQPQNDRAQHHRPQE